MTGPRKIGSSPTGMLIARVPAPKASVAEPRSTEATPMVAMITAITGRPISGRSTTRSKPKPNTAMPAIASNAQIQNESPAK